MSKSATERERERERERFTPKSCYHTFKGEYYIDRANKKLYVWPNTPLQTLTSSDTVYGSMLDTCIR